MNFYPSKLCLFFMHELRLKRAARKREGTGNGASSCRLQMGENVDLMEIYVERI